MQYPKNSLEDAHKREEYLLELMKRYGKEQQQRTWFTSNTCKSFRDRLSSDGYPMIHLNVSIMTDRY